MLDPASEDDIRFSDDEEIEKPEPVDQEEKIRQAEEMEEVRKERERELKELKEKEKKQAAEVNPTQFLIREGYTTEHRVAIMNREVKYLMSLGKYLSALPVCCDAILLNQSPLSYLNRAHIYKALKRYEEAIADFNTVIVNDTLNTAASLCQCGICYSKLLDYESAIENLNKSYQLDPSFSTAFNRGFIFAESGDHESAVLDYNKIVEGKKDCELKSRTIYHRALSFVSLKRYDDAKFDLRSILLKDPNAVPPRVLLSKAYKFTGHFVQSEECLNQCITKDCVQAELFIERSYVRCRLGSNHNLKEAYKDITKAMAIYVREYDEQILREKKKRLTDLLLNEEEPTSPVTLVRGKHPRGHASSDNLPKLTAANLHLKESPRGKAVMSKQNSFDLRHTLSRHSSAGSIRSGTKSKPNSRPGSSSTTRRPKSISNTGGNSGKSLQEPVKMVGLGRKSSMTSMKDVVPVEEPIIEVEYFGNTKIASVYAKLAQLLNLMQPDFCAPLSNFDVALENAEKAMRICPDTSSFTMIYLTCLLRLSKYTEASLLLDEILKKDPKHKKALYYKAFCHRADNDPYNAVDCLTKILSLSSRESDTDTDVGDDDLLDGESFLLRVLEMRGLLLHEQKAYKFALADFGRAICIDYTRPGNFYFRGNCHSKLGNFELAIEDFCLAEECKFPNLPFLLMCKGVVLRLIGANESAVEEFDRAIAGIDASKGERDQNLKLLLCRVYIYKSLSFITMKKYDEALENLLKIGEAVDGTLSNRKIPRSHMARHGSKSNGFISVKPGEGFEDVIDPTLRWLVSYHIALCQYMLKEYSESMKLLKHCLGTLRKYVPDDIALGSCIFFYCESACLVYKSSNPEEELFMQKCVDMLGECLDTDWCRVKDYNMMLCHFALGKCHQRLERHSAALEHFTEAKSLLEDQDAVLAYIYFRRAWSYKALSSYKLAAEDFESAKMLKLNDPNFSINYRNINNVAYIEIDNEPDTIEEFMPIFPSFDV